MESVLTAGEGKHNAVFGSLLDKLRVVIPTGTGTITSAYQEEMPDCAGLDCRNYLVCNTENCIVSKTGHHRFPAVDTGKRLIFRKSAQFQSFLDYGRKVILLINMDHLRIGNDLRGEYPICVTCLRRHQTVGGEENGGG